MATVVTCMAFPVCSHIDKKSGVQCKRKSRGATGLCCRHGGAICTYPGCKKSGARFAGCRCAVHAITKPKSKVENVKNDKNTKVKKEQMKAEVACLGCAAAVATHVCEHCKTHTFCERCLWRLRNRAANLHKQVDHSHDTNRFPKLPRCYSCMRPAQHIMIHNGILYNHDVDVRLAACLVFIRKVKGIDPLIKMEQHQYFRRILRRHGLVDVNTDCQHTISLAESWYQCVQNDTLANWQVFRSILDVVSDDFPVWASDPNHSQQSQKPKPMLPVKRRLLDLLYGFNIIDVLRAVSGFADGEPLKFFQEYHTKCVSMGGYENPDQVYMLVAFFSDMQDFGYTKSLVFHSVYCCYSKSVRLKIPSTIPAWAKVNDYTNDMYAEVDIRFASITSARNRFIDMLAEFRNVDATYFEIYDRKFHVPANWEVPVESDGEQDCDSIDVYDGKCDMGETYTSNESEQEQVREVLELNKMFMEEDKKASYIQSIEKELQPIGHKRDVLLVQIKRLVNKYKRFRHMKQYHESFPQRLIHELPMDLRPCKASRARALSCHGDMPQKPRVKRFKTSIADSTAAESFANKPDLDLFDTSVKIQEQVCTLSDFAFSRFLTTIRHGGVVVSVDDTLHITPDKIDLVKMSLEQAIIYDSVARISAGSSVTLGLHAEHHGQGKAAAIQHGYPVVHNKDTFGFAAGN